MPNMITWEPLFAVELSWILAETARRHFLNENAGRTGVLVRAVTRGIKQAQMLERLRRQRRFKQDAAGAGGAGVDAGAGLGPVLSADPNPRAGAVAESAVAALGDAVILEAVRKDCLEGAYLLVDYRGYDAYEPGDNVVKVFVMGALGPEALAASDRLLAKGIYADVIVVTSPDLLLGNLGYANGYRHLKEGLGVTGDLWLGKARPVESHAELMTLSGGRVPLVSVCDGEPGLLDNVGSIVGVKHEALAVRKAWKCGRPSDVYAYHHLDAESIAAAAERVLEESAEEGVRVRRGALDGR